MNEFSGESEIRTHDTFRYGAFQERCLQPLGHLSVLNFIPSIRDVFQSSFWSGNALRSGNSGKSIRGYIIHYYFYSCLCGGHLKSHTYYKHTFRTFLPEPRLILLSKARQRQPYLLICVRYILYPPYSCSRNFCCMSSCLILQQRASRKLRMAAP